MWSPVVYLFLFNVLKLYFIGKALWVSVTKTEPKTYWFQEILFLVYLDLFDLNHRHLKRTSEFCSCHGLKHNWRMVRLWCLAFSLFVFGANFSFAKADSEDFFYTNRINDFFGRDHEEFFDNIGRLIGKF